MALPGSGEMVLSILSQRREDWSCGWQEAAVTQPGQVAVVGVFGHFSGLGRVQARLWEVLVFVLICCDSVALPVMSCDIVRVHLGDAWLVPRTTGASS